MTNAFRAPKSGAFVAPFGLVSRDLKGGRRHKGESLRSGKHIAQDALQNFR
jgi:hypothetical protein